MFWHRGLIGLVAVTGFLLSVAQAQPPASGPAPRPPGGPGAQPPSRPMPPPPGTGNQNPMPPIPPGGQVGTLPTTMPPAAMMPSYPAGAGYGGAPGYGGAQGGYGSGQSNATGASPGQPPSQPSGPSDIEVFLTASGVPNDGGRLKWPFALKIMGAPDDEEMRRRTEALFRVAAMQSQAGQVNPRLTQELTRSVQALRARLRAENDRSVMQPAVLEEAQRFLDRLEHAPELLANTLTVPAPGGTARLQGAAPARQPER